LISAVKNDQKGSSLEKVGSRQKVIILPSRPISCIITAIKSPTTAQVARPSKWDQGWWARLV